MSTFEEINTSKRLNRKFHNDGINFCITLIREYKRLADSGSALHKGLYNSYISNLQERLYKRRHYVYLDEKLKTKLNVVEVCFSDPKYNYKTNVSFKSNIFTCAKYFIGQRLNIGIFPEEDMQICTNIIFNGVSYK